MATSYQVPIVLLNSLREWYLLYIISAALFIAPRYIRKYRIRKAFNALPLVGTDNTKLGELIKYGTKQVRNRLKLLNRADNFLVSR